MIVLQTNHGDITIALNHEKAPVTAANFEQSSVMDWMAHCFTASLAAMVQGGGFIRISTRSRHVTR